MTNTVSATAVSDADFGKLAAEAAGGDKRAFGILYGLLVHDVWTFLRSRCDNDAICEDLVAGVFLKAWDKASSQRTGSANYRAWVFAIARNELRDHWRREKRDADLTAMMAAVELCQSEPRANGLETEALAAALSKLTEDQRDVVMLRLLAELSSQEVSRMLGKSEGAVRALQFRAMQSMKAMTKRSS